MNEDIKIIIENAIKEEEYFSEFYKKLAESANDEKVKEGLLRLSEQERIHKEKLLSLNLHVLGVVPGIITKEDVEAEVSLTPVEEFASVKDMLAFAVKQEVQAELMYKKLSASTEDEDAKKLFDMLAEEEKEHKMLLTGELAVIANQ